MALASCAPADTRAAANAPEDALETGPETTFASLNPCLDEILVELASPAQILALSPYSREPGATRMDPEIAARFAFTGGTAEEIIALDPDIVLASAFLAPATRSALERAGLRVETFGSPRSVNESLEQVERIARLSGHDASARTLEASLFHPPASPSTGGRGARASGPDPSVLLWQAGQIVAGGETLIAELLKEAGFASHAEALGLAPADHVALERIISDPPDLLLVAGDSAGQRHPALGKLAKTQVRAFDPALFYCGGPSIAQARFRLAELRRDYERQAP